MGSVLNNTHMAPGVKKMLAKATMVGRKSPQSCEEVFRCRFKDS
jgi:hypothetical protein